MEDVQTGELSTESSPLKRYLFCRGVKTKIKGEHLMSHYDDQWEDKAARELDKEVKAITAREEAKQRSLKREKVLRDLMSSPSPFDSDGWDWASELRQKEQAKEEGQTNLLSVLGFIVDSAKSGNKTQLKLIKDISGQYLKGFGE